MPRIWLWVALIAWFVAMLGGQWWLLAYQYTAGEEPFGLLTDWPAESALGPTPERFTLLLFAHPRCPCSQASLKELEWLVANADAPLDAAVLLWHPADAPADWVPPWWTRQAGGLPPYSLLIDEGGREASLFHVTTSGTVLLFNGDGHLLYRGGITKGRGHRGDNPGRQAILRLLREHAATDRQPVFGCPLCGHAES